VDSVESRQSKVTRRSASHSTAPMHSAMGSTGVQSPAIPSTKISPSHSVSPVDDQVLHGASHTTDGVF
jgi:hypothetical protein